MINTAFFGDGLNLFFALRQATVSMSCSIRRWLPILKILNISGPERRAAFSAPAVSRYLLTGYSVSVRQRNSDRRTPGGKTDRQKSRTASQPLARRQS